MYFVYYVSTFMVAGSIANVQNAMMIGAKGCADDNMGFLEGRIDEVSRPNRRHMLSGYILFHRVSPSQLWSASISLSIYCHL